MMMLYTHSIVGVDANLVLTNLSIYFLLYTSTIKIIIVNLLSWIIELLRLAEEDFIVEERFTIFKLWSNWSIILLDTSRDIYLLL